MYSYNDLLRYSAAYAEAQAEAVLLESYGKFDAADDVRGAAEDSRYMVSELRKAGISPEFFYGEQPVYHSSDFEPEPWWAQ